MRCNGEGFGLARSGGVPWKSLKSLSSRQWGAQGGVGRGVCVTCSPGSKWIVTAAHCLHQVLDPEDLTLDDSYLLSPSDFEIIMGE